MCVVATTQLDGQIPASIFCDGQTQILDLAANDDEAACRTASVQIDPLFSTDSRVFDQCADNSRHY
jgi:hypothetical protein